MDANAICNIIDTIDRKPGTNVGNLNASSGDIKTRTIVYGKYALLPKKIPNSQFGNLI